MQEPQALTSACQSKSIAILTGISLSGNPRTIKEAATLAKAGFAVTVFGASPTSERLKFDEELAGQHGFVFRSVGGGPTRVLPRLKYRLSVGIFRLLGIESHWQLGRAVDELDREARAANADYYIVHAEQAAWVGARLLRAGRNVGADIEDFYSEDLLPEARRDRPLRLIRTLERILLLQCAHTTCESNAMSAGLADTYDSRRPTVIYSAFPWAERARIDGAVVDRVDRRLPSIHWFSQTLGPDRGLGDLFAALPYLECAAQVHLRGTAAAGFHEWMADKVPEPWLERIFIHDLVPNGELLSRIVEHDIGLAAEIPYCKNKDFSASNKILYYLLGGLAIVASDTAGQIEVANGAPNAVLLYKSGDAKSLAGQLNALLNSPERLTEAKAAALDAAERRFCWEEQETTLLKCVTLAMGLGSVPVGQP